MAEKASVSGHMVNSMESPSIQITAHRLNGENFLRWAQSVKFFVSGRGKMDLLDGTKRPLKPGDEGYQTWHAENYMLMAWLINSMEPEISQGYILYTTAKDIWEAVNLMYSNQGNDSKLYELGEKARAVKQAAMQQKVTVLNKRGEKLIGVLHETGSAKLVVLCHGFRSTKEYNTMVNLAAAFEKEGISAFRFDFSGNGESEGSFQYGNYLSEAEDLRSVVEHFTGVNRSTIGILGHSKGGDVVLLYASKYHDIPVVINVSGRYDLKGGIEERLGKDIWETLNRDGYIDVKTRTGEVDYRVTKESMMERLNTNMHEVCLSIDEKCKVLTVHGSADEVIPVQDAKEFAKIIPNHRLKIIEGANHGYSSHQDELVSVVLPFIKECMQEDENVSNQAG